MTKDAAPSSRASIRRHVVAGSVFVAILALGLGGWASTAEISGALIAEGTIVVDSNVKKVQHPTGGVVGELLVHDGDHVEAGQLLVRLDEVRELLHTRRTPGGPEVDQHHLALARGDGLVEVVVLHFRDRDALTRFVGGRGPARPCAHRHAGGTGGRHRVA